MPPKRRTNKKAPPKKAQFKVKKAVRPLTPPPTQEKQHKTGFLDLPPELRNRVYQVELIRAMPYQIPAGKEPHRAEGEKPVVIFEPALLATTHQIRAEALPVFYGCNTFSVVYSLYGGKLLRQLGPERTAMLRTLEVVGDRTRPDGVYYEMESWMAACYQHTRRLIEKADGALKLSALRVPLGPGGGYIPVQNVDVFEVEEDGDGDYELKGLLF